MPSFRELPTWLRRAILVLALFSGWIGLTYAITWDRTLVGGEKDGILILGGSLDRLSGLPTIVATTGEAVPVILSDRANNHRKAQQIVQEQKLKLTDFRLDCLALDTVTNFTTTLESFKKAGVRRVHVLTSSEHITRSMAIAWVVLGSAGIKPVAHATAPVGPQESIFRIIRDMVRSCVWFWTGYTWATLRPDLVTEEIEKFERLECQG